MVELRYGLGDANELRRSPLRRQSGHCLPGSFTKLLNLVAIVGEPKNVIYEPILIFGIYQETIPSILHKLVRGAGFSRTNHRQSGGERFMNHHAPTVVACRVNKHICVAEGFGPRRVCHLAKKSYAATAFIIHAFTQGLTLWPIAYDGQGNISSLLRSALERANQHVDSLPWNK